MGAEFRQFWSATSHPIPIYGPHHSLGLGGLSIGILCPSLLLHGATFEDAFEERYQTPLFQADPTQAVASATILRRGSIFVTCSCTYSK